MGAIEGLGNSFFTRVCQPCIAKAVPELACRTLADYNMDPGASFARLQDLARSTAPEREMTETVIYRKGGVECALREMKSLNVLNMYVRLSGSKQPVGKFMFHPTHYEFHAPLFSNTHRGMIFKQLEGFEDMPLFDDLRILDPALLRAKTVAMPVVRDDCRAKFIDQGSYSIASAGDISTELKTLTVAICMAMTLYDPGRKVGVLAHFDAMSDIYASFQEVTAALRDEYRIGPESLEAKLVGGRTDMSEVLLINIYMNLKRSGIPLVQTDVLEPLWMGPENNHKEYFRDVWFDVKTGRICLLRDTRYPAAYSDSVLAANHRYRMDEKYVIKRIK